MGELSKKLFWLAFWVIGFAVFMTCLLLYFKFQGVFSSLQKDRVLLVVQEIDAITEKSLSLGQGFAEMSALQDVIDRRRASDALITSIEVVSADGKIAYATDKKQVGKPAPAGLVEQIQRQPKLAYLDEGHAAGALAATVRNSFNVVAGFVVVRYSRAEEHAAVQAFLARAAMVGGAAFVGFTLLLFGLLVWIEKRLAASLDAAEDALLLGAESNHPSAGLISAQLKAADQALAYSEAQVAGREQARAT